MRMISFDDFSKLDLRIGTILEANIHPNADKLLVLKVDIGEKTVQLVAGIRQSYSSEELVGKNIAVLTNLEPRTVRGVESQGMLLAAQAGGAIRLLMPDGDLPPGAIIK